MSLIPSVFDFGPADFGSLFDPFFARPVRSNDGIPSPHISREVKDDKVVIKLGLAGIPGDKIHVNRRGDSLEVSFEESNKDDSSYFYRSGSQSFDLTGTDLDNVQVELDNGLLVITAPLQRKATQTEVPVKVIEGSKEGAKA